MRLTIHHQTVYEYPRSVTNSVNEVWLRPLSDERQSCLSFRLTTTPYSEPRPYTDYYGNTVYHFDIPEPHNRLEIVADAEVMTQEPDVESILKSDTTPYGPLPPSEADRWLDFLSHTPLTTPGDGVRAFVAALGRSHATVGELALDISNRVYGALRYEPGITGVHTTSEDALRLQVGVCQDYTHLYLSISRSLGIPARYVSGYLSTGAGPDQTQASHAWPEVLLPTAGWIGLDPTNGRVVDGRYVRVAIGRDYVDVPPVRGAYSGIAGGGFDVSVYVLSEQQQQQQQ
jgi:transglutaminase-like putative cysteine protease